MTGDFANESILKSVKQEALTVFLICKLYEAC